MRQGSMTALMSAFVRAWHAKNNSEKVFNDSVAADLLGDDYEAVAAQLARGADFFCPGFSGTPQQALRLIVDGQLAPVPLARAAYAERMLENALRLGTAQYLILAAGYDTFAFRRSVYAGSLRIFELDHPQTLADKQRRARHLALPENRFFIPADLRAGRTADALLASRVFSPDQITYCSLLGISYYLDRAAFSGLLSELSEIFPGGSALVFDYPDALYFTDRAEDRVKRQIQMAAAAGEPMAAGYPYRELEELLAAHGFLIYEHLAPPEIEKTVFGDYNAANPEYPIHAVLNVNLCLAVKR